jgi:MFS family permease
MGSVFITVIVFTPAFGKYIRLLGARKFLIIGSVVIGLGNFIFGFLSRIEDSNSFFALSVVIRIISCWRLCCRTFSLAAIQMNKEHRRKAIACVETSFAVGTMIVATIGGCLFDLGGFSLPFYVTCGLMMFLSVMSSLFFKDKTMEDCPKDNNYNLIRTDLFKTAGFQSAFFP